MKYMVLSLLLLSGCMADDSTLTSLTQDQVSLNGLSDTENPPTSVEAASEDNKTTDESSHDHEDHEHEEPETTEEVSEQTEEEIFNSFLQAMDDDVVHTHDIDFTPEDAISYAINVYGTDGIDYVYNDEAIAFADGIGYYIGLKKGDTMTTVLFITDSGEIHEEQL